MTKDDIIDITLEQVKYWGGAEALDEGLVLTENVTNPPTSYNPQRFNCILMSLCKKGEAHYSINTRELTAKAGDLLFISERHILDYYSVSEDYESLNFFVSTEFYHSFVLNARNVSSLLLFSVNNPVVHLTPTEAHTYTTYFQAIRQKMTNTEHRYHVQVVKALMLAMFYDMSNVIWRVNQNEDPIQTSAQKIFSQFINLIEQNFRTERRVGWYAEQLGISSKYLSETVKAVSKRTPNEWIDHYVMLELRVMLRNTSKSIKEITKELNFPNQSFLGKYFKEHMGQSPSAFRRGQD